MDISQLSNPVNSARASHNTRNTAKSVKFELVNVASRHAKARLPMRVQIFPHDTTESIVTTVKNFYGLYPNASSARGVSFEDEQHNTLIARYENFHNNMVVYVRVIEASPSLEEPNATTSSDQPVQGPDGISIMAAPCLNHHISRPTSTVSRRRSPSPDRLHDGSRSASTSTHDRNGRAKSTTSQHPPAVNGDSFGGYTSGDGAPGSTSSKSKDHIANTEISVENIVEGGRRKRAKFESSELPLFAPPQMPAATSNPSISPARRSDHHRVSLPMPPANHNPFAIPRPLQSPHNYQNGFNGMSLYAIPHVDHRRARNSISYPSGPPQGLGILPTPDPTVGSTMSEEDKDVALQLMRLGDTSMVSQGRTSASTLDETFSGRADATSSTGATSNDESEEEEGDYKRRKVMSGNSKTILPTTKTHFMPRSTNGSDLDGDYMGSPQKTLHSNGFAAPKPRSQSTTSKPNKTHKSSKSMSKKSEHTYNHDPMSPASRKQSISSSMDLMSADGDQPDLSSKPRCQRCRKSKKGCDRQRPCGRCRDAGLPAEMCVSEDEGNGRKGRYGRHMGVPLKGEELPLTLTAAPSLLPAASIMARSTGMEAPVFMAPYAPDKNKKRKR